MFKVFCHYPFRTSEPEIFEAEALAYDENKYLIVREIKSRELMSIKSGYIFLDIGCTKHLNKSILATLPGKEIYYDFLKEM